MSLPFYLLKSNADEFVKPPGSALQRQPVLAAQHILDATGLTLYMTLGQQAKVPACLPSHLCNSGSWTVVTGLSPRL